VGELALGWVIGLLVALVAGHFLVEEFLCRLRKHMGMNPEQAPGQVPRSLTGFLERVFFVALIGFQVQEAVPAMIGWLGVKIAANWGRSPPEGESLENRTRYAFSALVAGLVSMFFALIGGLIAAGEIWPR
jgi:hypothetical protein